MGELSVDTTQITQDQILALRRKTGFVFQNYGLFKNKTVLENITEALIRVKKIKKAHAQERGLSILNQVGMSGFEEYMPSKLSGGQQQRVGIGRALALDADVLLFDEPTSSLDPERVDEILQLMNNIGKLRKHALVIVTHEIHFARKVANRIVFMENGNIAAVGKPSNLLDQPKDSRIARFSFSSST